MLEKKYTFREFVNTSFLSDIEMSMLLASGAAAKLEETFGSDFGKHIHRLCMQELERILERVQKEVGWDGPITQTSEGLLVIQAAPAPPKHNMFSGRIQWRNRAFIFVRIKGHTCWEHQICWADYLEDPLREVKELVHFFETLREREVRPFTHLCVENFVTRLRDSLCSNLEHKGRRNILEVKRAPEGEAHFSIWYKKKILFVELSYFMTADKEASLKARVYQFLKGKRVEYSPIKLAQILGQGTMWEYLNFAKQIDLLNTELYEQSVSSDLKPLTSEDKNYENLRKSLAHQILAAVHRGNLCDPPERLRVQFSSKKSLIATFKAEKEEYQLTIVRVSKILVHVQLLRGVETQWEALMSVARESTEKEVVYLVTRVCYKISCCESSK